MFFRTLGLPHKLQNSKSSSLFRQRKQTRVFEFSHGFYAEVKVSRNGPERRSSERIIAGTAFRLEFLVGWYYDADATMVVPELY